MAAKDAREGAPAPGLVRLARFVAGLRDAEVPPRVLRAATLELVSAVAAARTSARSPSVRQVLGGLFLGDGPSTVVATGARHAPAEAAYVNAAYSMVQDFDDIVWMGHTSHSTVFAALAVAEAEGATVGALRSAIVAATEVAGRLGASCFFGPLNGQMWTFVHAIGAAAATASLLALDAERTAHALAIALAQPPFALQPAFLAPSSKWLAAATPTHAGVQAAYLARAGMTGALDLLENPRGFWRVFSFRPLRGMLDDLGRFWVLDTLTVKTYPTCHYFQTACSALEELLHEQRAGARGGVAGIEVHTNKLAVEVTMFGATHARSTGPVTPVDVGFDLRMALAVLVVAGRLCGDEATPEWLAAHTERLREAHGRIRVEHDPALTLRVVEGARAVETGRAALRALGLADLVALRRRYREHYGSSLIAPREITAWLRALRAGGVLRASSTTPVAGARAPVALYFPSRVRVRFGDGSSAERRVDLPVGSVAAAGCEAEVCRKWALARVPDDGVAAMAEARAFLAWEPAHPARGLMAALASVRAEV